MTSTDIWFDVSIQRHCFWQDMPCDEAPSFEEWCAERGVNLVRKFEDPHAIIFEGDIPDPAVAVEFKLRWFNG
jgi:hypothetical protein